MKGYYLFAPVEADCVGPDSGVERKVRAQHRALSELADCELVILPAPTYADTKWDKIVKRLPFTAAWRKWSYKGEFDSADFLYIRQVYHDASFARYLRAIRRRNPNIKIVYEIPTYPYETAAYIFPQGAGKPAMLSNVPFLIKERLGRYTAAANIDRIVTFYGQDRIFGVECIKTYNGFDFSKVKLPEREKKDTIDIISVAQTAFWHGYDRVIEGLHRYYEGGGRENFVYHMVGNVMPEHLEAVKRYGLENKVIFYGRKSGGELERLYAAASLGVDVLGGHRKDYPVSSSLKSREYAAYGLPVITSSPVDYMPRDYPYQLLAPYDDSPLDMGSVAEFYHAVYDGRDMCEVAEGIRSFAEKRCDMVETMRPIAEYLESK